MKLAFLLLSLLYWATCVFAQVQILWDVPVQAPLTDSLDSSRHLKLLDNGNILVWGTVRENPASPDWGPCGYWGVFDTLGQYAGHSGVIAGRWGSAIYDMRQTEFGMVAAYVRKDTVGFLQNYAGLRFYDSNFDSVSAFEWDVQDLLCRHVVIGEDRVYFAGLSPAYSLAPHARVLAFSLTGSPLWDREVLPYRADNMNAFYSMRLAAHFGLVLTATWGLPSEGRNRVLRLTPQGNTAGGLDIATTDSIFIENAIETAGGSLWVACIRGSSDTGLYSLLLQDYSTGAQFSRTMCNQIQGCNVGIMVAPVSGGVLVSGAQDVEHSTSYLLRQTTLSEPDWYQAMPNYELFTDIILHPDGGYLAVAIAHGDERYYHLVRFIETVAGTDNAVAPQPFAFSLAAYPNPFNPSTEITINLSKAERAVVKVFDILGQQVSVLQDGMLTAGEHRVTFDGGQLGAGIYFLRLEAATHQKTLKLVLLK